MVHVNTPSFYDAYNPSGNDKKYKPNDVVGNTIYRPSKVGPLLVALIITYRYLIIIKSFSPDVSI